MAEEPEQLKEYEYEHAGGTYTAILNERHAKRLNAKPVGVTSTATEDLDAAGGDATGKPVTSASTKARGAQNKSE